MKKLVSLVLAVLLALSCVSFASAEEPVEIRYLFGLGGNLGDLFLGLIDEYNASQSAVHVTPIQVASYGTAEETYQANLAAGDQIEVWHATTGTKRHFFDYVEPLNDWYEDESFNQADILKGAKDCCIGPDGETLMAVPLWCTVQLMYYRKDAFEGYDVEELFKNWQNLADACAEIVAAGKVEFGWEPMAGADNLVDILMCTGTTFNGYYTDSTMREVNFLSDEWIDVCESFRKWIHDDKIMSTHWGGTGWEYWYATIDDVMNGKAGGYTGSAGDQGDLDFSIIAAHPQPGWRDHESNVHVGTHLLYMGKNISDEKKLAAWDFMKYLSSPAVQGKISMCNGYSVTRQSAAEDPDYAAFLEKNPQMMEVIKAIACGQQTYEDITGGYISTAVEDLAERIELEGMDAVEALTICQEEAQAALDEYWAEVDSGI